jgi:hypothetical protein
VIELFTSEGCSSCPPADRLLATLASEADRSGDPVFALSFHVDYWDYLGWSDPFGRPEFTERQKAYAEALGGGVYTPEMIVNGRTAFTGSNEAKARRALRAALSRPARCRFESLEAKKSEGNIQVTYAGSVAGRGSLLRLALVLPDTAIPVGRGENSGRTLRHHGVVRVFKSMPWPVAGKGRAVLAVPAGVRPEDLRLVAYVQDAGTLAILGAAASQVRR